MSDKFEFGSGVYPWYSAFWHLHKTGIITDIDTFDSPAWDDAAAQPSDHRPTRVALIDNSVAWQHPNLANCVNSNLMIDFFSSRLGAFPGTPNFGDLADLFTSDDNQQQRSTKMLVQQQVAPVTSVWDDFRNRISVENQRDRYNRIQAATLSTFSAHGTAMAGLIGARPVPQSFATPVILKPSSSLAQEILTNVPQHLPYAGADPFCEIVPISTSFAPDCIQLILALLYAHLIRADLIVIARDFPDPERSMPDSIYQQTARCPDFPLATQTLRDALRDLTVEISKERPILCAAGNGSDDLLVNPATLADTNNGIIAVGARTALGSIAGYSPSFGNPASIVYAPSGDGERLDDNLQRLDTQSTALDRLLHDSSYRDSLDTNADDTPDTAVDATSVFAVQDLITTDVPGRGGYNGSPYRDIRDDNNDFYELASHYCHFSGTSGAVGVAGGFASLLISAGKLSVLGSDGVSSGPNAGSDFKKDLIDNHTNSDGLLSWT